jgi:heme exporter protein C
MLILFFLYIAYILINFLIEDFHKAAKVSSIFALVGLIDIPIIKFSVEWWNTLHQGASVIRSGGPSIDASMLKPLLITATGMMFLVMALIFLGTLTELIAIKIKRHYRQKVYHE